MCVKCGSEASSAVTWLSPRSGRWFGIDYIMGECLVYQCKRCGYHWTAATKDQEVRNGGS